MYNNYVLFLIGLFVFTILIQYLDKQIEQKQEQEQEQKQEQEGDVSIGKFR